MLDGLTLRKVDERFKFLSLMIFGISSLEVMDSELHLHPEQISKERVKVGFKVVVDYLDRFEAALISLLLTKRGLTRGVDFEVEAEIQGSRFIVAAKPCEGVDKVLNVFDKIRELVLAKRYAIHILDQWRSRGNFGKGDVDDALNIGYRILRERTQAYDEPCPQCGRTGSAQLTDRIREGEFIVHVKKLCCGYTKKLVIPIEIRFMK